MKKVNVALIGTGWAGAMHARSYQKVTGRLCSLKTVCSLEPNLEEFAFKWNFESFTNSYEKVLKDPLIDVIDIVTPPNLHEEMVKQALKAGKHVICEKPLTGSFDKSSGKKMLKDAEQKLKEIQAEIEKSGKILCYAENWIYSPPFMRAVELIEKKKTVVPLIYGQTGHKGSHAKHAAYWKANGGGTLIRQGSHPIAAAIYLKKKELEAREERFGIQSVFCDASCITKEWSEQEKGALHTSSFDVEDWAQVVITFSDGTKATIMSGDMLLGQIYNRMEVFGNDSVYQINMTPNNLLETYMANDTGIEQEELMEKSEGNTGWQHTLVIEDIIRGYAGQLQDFLECIAYGRKPQSDFALARDTLKVIYAAYQSAEEERKIILENRKE